MTFDNRTRVAPATAAERRDASMSFGDQQSLVYQALLAALGDDAADDTGYIDIWIKDLADDWVVWHCYGTNGPGPGDWKQSYTLDGTAVTLVGAPETVVQQTTYVPVEAKSKSRVIAARSALFGPEERRSSREALRNVRETRLCPLEFELRDVPNGTGGTDILFSGYASVTNRAYEMQDFAGEFNEEIVAGAFRKTLDEGCDTAFLLNHEGMTLARTKAGTLKLSETMEGVPTGLHTAARLDPQNPTVTAMRSAIERGDLDEMSFAFRVTRQRWVWAEDSGQADAVDHRYIQEVNLNQGDVSLVNYGANPHTGGYVAVRSGEPDWQRMFELYATADQEIRAGKTLSSATMEQLNQTLLHLGDSDTAAARQVITNLISSVDPAATGSSGNTETESAKPGLELLAAYDLLVARNREQERGKRRRAA